MNAEDKGNTLFIPLQRHCELGEKKKGGGGIQFAPFPPLSFLGAVFVMKSTTESAVAVFNDGRVCQSNGREIKNRLFRSEEE